MYGYQYKNKTYAANGTQTQCLADELISQYQVTSPLQFFKVCCPLESNCFFCKQKSEELSNQSKQPDEEKYSNQSSFQIFLLDKEQSIIKLFYTDDAERFQDWVKSLQLFKYGDYQNRVQNNCQLEMRNISGEANTFLVESVKSSNLSQQQLISQDNTLNNNQHLCDSNLNQNDTNSNQLQILSVSPLDQMTDETLLANHGDYNYNYGLYTFHENGDFQNNDYENHFQQNSVYALEVNE